MQSLCYCNIFDRLAECQQVSCTDNFLHKRLLPDQLLGVITIHQPCHSIINHPYYSSRWLAQFTPGSREDIVCRKDGTLRHSEPSAGENLSCIVVFVLVFYSEIAAMVWFIIFAYSFHLRAVGKYMQQGDVKFTVS